MKRKLIADLDERVTKVTFPSYDGAWALYASGIREVVKDALGHEVSEVEWNDEPSTTYGHQWSLKARFSHRVVAADGTEYTGSFRVYLHLDPKKPLLGELKRLQDEMFNIRQGLVNPDAIRKTK